MRTTPSLLGLYSLVTLWACDLFGRGHLPYAAAWYKKTDFTFSDAIGAVRLTLCDQDIYRQCPPDPGIPKTQTERLKRMTQGRSSPKCIMLKVKLIRRSMEISVRSVRNGPLLSPRVAAG